MASKRVAGHQITKDEYDASERRGEDDAPVVAGKWKEASEETLAARQFASIKRKPAAEGEEKPSAFPTFNLTNTESAPAPSFNAFAKFAAAPGEWECPSCEVRNKKEAKKCAACEAKNPNAEEGDEKSASEKNAATASLFTFGAPASGGAESATFANPFGSGTFNFSNNVTFGSVSGDSSSSGFSTGTFEFKDSAPLESTPAAGPVEAFKDAKPAPTGEEGETNLLKVHGKAYILSDVAPEKEGEEGKEAAAPASEKKKKFQELGEGDLHLNTKEEEGKIRARFVMRADKTQRLILNCALFKAMKVEAQGDKYVRFPSVGEDGKIECHLLKFKSKGEVESVVEAANKAIATLP